MGAVIFIPTLALALGVFSSGSRAFEVVYLIWWYIGPFQKTAGIDFISGPPQVYLLAAAGLLLLSACWRGRQVRVYGSLNTSGKQGSGTLLSSQPEGTVSEMA